MVPAPVRYIYCWDDYVILSRVVRRESFLKRFQLVIVPALLTLGFVMILVALTLKDGGNAGQTLMAALSIWWVWLFPFAATGFVLLMNRIELAVWYKKQRLDGVEVSVRFDNPQGLETTSKDGTGIINWGSIRKVVTEGDAHVALQENRIIGLCMPRRAFADDAHFAATSAHIERKMAENRVGVASQ